MIFVTIGTQEPFDRFIKAVDKIAGKLNLEVTAQVSLNSSYNCKYIKCINFLHPIEFDKILIESDLIISHAGMGTIISSLINKKQLIVFPRQKKLNEHRSDHQVASAMYFEKLNYITVAWDEYQLELLLQDFMANNLGKYDKEIGNFGSSTLIDSIKSDIYDNL